MKPNLAAAGLSPFVLARAKTFPLQTQSKVLEAAKQEDLSWADTTRRTETAVEFRRLIAEEERLSHDFNKEVTLGGLRPSKAQRRENEERAATIEGHKQSLLAVQAEQFSYDTPSMDSIRDWLTSRRDERFKRRADMALPKGDLKANLEKNRAQLDALKQQASQIRGDSLTLAEAIGKATAQIDELVADPQFARTLRYGAALVGDQQWGWRIPETVVRQYQGSVTIPDALGMFAYIHRDALVAKATADIKAAFDPKRAMSIPDRKKSLAGLAEEIVALEHRDEALLLQCRAAGIPAKRRGNASLLAFLELEVDRSPPAPAKDSESEDAEDFG